MRIVCPVMTACVVSEMSGIISMWYDMTGCRFLALVCTCRIMLEHMGSWLCRPGHETGQACMATHIPPATFFSAHLLWCVSYRLTSNSNRSRMLGALRGVRACSESATTAQPNSSSHIGRNVAATLSKCMQQSDCDKTDINVQ
jgi:hypothetical protein